MHTHVYMDVRSVIDLLQMPSPFVRTLRYGHRHSHVCVCVCVCVFVCVCVCEFKHECMHGIGITNPVQNKMPSLATE